MEKRRRGKRHKGTDKKQNRERWKAKWRIGNDD
jgi:hypothetical protein